MNARGSQACLFAADIAPAVLVSGVPAGWFDPAAHDVALTGDGYRWLADLLPAPQPPACERCGRPMSLPAVAPVLWGCPACHPAEAA
jgi:hypothetical protein